MSWIHEHWDNKYIALSERKIKDLVSFFHGSALETFLVTSLKMSDYRKKATTGNNSEGLVQTPEPDGADLSDEEEAFMSLADQYGLKNMKIGGSRENRQSVEHEYQAYTTAPVSPRTVSLLKFWEVGDLVTVMTFQYH